VVRLHVRIAAALSLGKHTSSLSSLSWNWREEEKRIRIKVTSLTNKSKHKHKHKDNRNFGTFVIVSLVVTAVGLGSVTCSSSCGPVRSMGMRKSKFLEVQDLEDVVTMNPSDFIKAMFCL
jgi:hypothetical protein